MPTLGTMDPNSTNQRWSRWVFDVHTGGLRLQPFRDIKQAAAIFGRIRFGSASEMHVSIVHEDGRRRVRIKVRTEGHPVHDPLFRVFMHREWTRWAIRGFGNGTTCELVEAKLEAGDRQDGTPRDQLIIMDAAKLPSLKG